MIVTHVNNQSVEYYLLAMYNYNQYRFKTVDFLGSCANGHALSIRPAISLCDGWYLDKKFTYREFKNELLRRPKTKS